MKKILSTFLILSVFVFALVLPVFLGLHAGMMSHHGMSAGDCIEHCISSEAYIYSDRVVLFGESIEVFIIKVFSTGIFEFSIPLILLYVLLKYIPPNIYYPIKNYNYSLLIGIIKLTT